MKIIKNRKCLIAAAALLAMALQVNAQSNSTAGSKFSLAGKHQFTITAGGLLDSDFADDQHIASFEYSYWINEQMAFTVGAGGIGTDDHGDCPRRCRYDDDEGVGMVLVGMQVRPEILNFTDRFFITLQGMVGPYAGVSHRYEGSWGDDGDRYRRHRERTETQVGAYLGVNLNVAVTRRFLIGASAGYHFVESFDHPINGETDYNSPDLRLRFSFML